MKGRTVVYFWFILMATLFFQPVYAEESKKALVDESTKLLFVDTAISTTHPFDGRQGASLLPPGIVTYKSYPFLDPIQFKKEFPWMYEFVYREKGLPKSVVINKWVQPVTISLGFPNRLRPVESPLINGKPVTEFDEWPNFFFTDIRLPDGGIPVNYYLAEGGTRPLEEQFADNIGKEIKKALPQLKKNSKLEIKYILPEKDTKENPAKVRIVFISDKDHSPWKTPYKQLTGRFMRPMTPPRPVYFRSIESRLYPVRFTPHSDDQVDGYFLTNEKNEIEFAFCFIRDDHEHALMRALIRECLIRTLGLPDLLDVSGLKRINFANHLGPWNAEDDKRWPPEQKKGFLGKEDGYTALDLQMLELLYTDTVKPGMDPIEAFKALP